MSQRIQKGSETMASQTDIHFAAGKSAGFFAAVTGGLARAWASLSNAMIAYGESRSRFAELQSLEAKSDHELADIGLKREDIVRHVFRDLYYL